MEVYNISVGLEIYSNISSVEFDSKYEAPILRQTLSYLQKICPMFNQQFRTIILLNNGVKIDSWKIDNKSSKKSVFIIFDEHGRLPTELVTDETNIVFHAHLSFSENEIRYRNLFHFPLNCNSFVPDLPYVPVDERKINVFFSGNLHVGRKKLYQELAHLPSLPFSILVRLQKILRTNFDNLFPSSYIRFTDGFSKGFSFEEYARYLSNSKIILSPPGISNPECFRHYEGLRAGCVVIAERLPIKPQFVGSPVIEVHDWSKGIELIENLIKNPSELDSISRQSYAWYQNHISPKPLAEYLHEKIFSSK